MAAASAAAAAAALANSAEVAPISFSCADCDYTNASKYKLNLHRRESHAGSLPYACELCTFRSARSNGAAVSVCRCTVCFVWAV
jgi:hypothetical protein